MTERELIDYSRQETARERKPTIPEVIADLARISDREFICGHTLKPFLGGFEESPAWYLPHGKNERTRTSKKLFPPNQERLFFCIKCATDDFRRLGRSFWRRSHQIPGVCWCSRHKIPLATCCSSHIRDQPHQLTAESKPCIDKSFPTKKSIEGRYLAVVAYLLTLRSPIPTAQLCQWLTRKAQERKIALDPGMAKSVLLSDVILKRCSTSWSQHLFQDFSQKQPGDYFSRIDNFWININNSATTYSLALAALFGDRSEVAMVIGSSYESVARIHIKRQLPNIVNYFSHFSSQEAR